MTKTSLLLPVVLLLALVTGLPAMPQENNYWDHATRLELAVLAGSESDARAAVNDAVNAKRVAWELDTTLYNLRLIRTAREERSAEVPAWFNDIESALQAAMNGS